MTNSIQDLQISVEIKKYVPELHKNFMVGSQHIDKTECEISWESTNRFRKYQYIYYIIF